MEEFMYLGNSCVELLIWELNCQSYAFQKQKRELTLPLQGTTGRPTKLCSQQNKILLAKLTKPV